jgi:hypothetical protein
MTHTVASFPLLTRVCEKKKSHDGQDFLFLPSFMSSFISYSEDFCGDENEILGMVKTGFLAFNTVKATGQRTAHSTSSMLEFEFEWRV